MDLRERPLGVDVRRHPWEVARAEFFLSLLAEHSLLGRGSVLDAGSGDAYFAERLAQTAPGFDPIVCWDRDYRADSRDALGITDPRITLCAEVPAQRFDLVVALDVLEHIEDDLDFVRTLAGQLEPGGTILVSVPAWDALATAHDERLLHHRRYTPAQLRHLLGEAGLTPVRSGGLFHSLLLPRAISAAVHRWGRARARTDEPDPLDWRHGRAVTATVYAALRADNWVSKQASRRGLAIPGLSEWCLCRAS